jgi:hypothetical protein
VLPPKLLGTPYQIFVLKTGTDGNDTAGIRTPDVAVPVATYTGWHCARRRQATRCRSSTAAMPPARKFRSPQPRAARLAAGDPRLSLQERYRDHRTYVQLVIDTAQGLKHERPLLDQDVQNYIAAAQAAAVP